MQNLSTTDGLNMTNQPVHPSIRSSRPTKSYAGVVTGVKPSTHSWTPNLIDPIYKGDYFSMQIDDAFYKKKIQECENYIIGRIILVNEDKH